MYVCARARALVVFFFCLLWMNVIYVGDSSVRGVKGKERRKKTYNTYR